MTPPASGVTVCITSADAGDLLSLTLDSVKAHTPPEVSVMVPGSGTTGGRGRGASVENDLVLLEPGCVVAGGWLDGVQDAAGSDAAVATVSALTEQDVNLRRGPGFSEAAAAARTRSLRLLPRLPAARGPCVYVRRSALELIGETGADGLVLVLAELSRRCTDSGLLHLLADDVLVLDRRPRPETPIAADQDGGPAARAAAKIRRVLTGPSAVIDARILYGPTTGTHVHVLELVAGLARTGRLRLTMIVPDDPSEFAAGRLRSLHGVSLVTYRDASSAHGPRADIVHRPFQLSNAGDLTFLTALGDRLILTQQDLIAYRNPSYFAAPEAWREYRQLTAIALSAADHVAFFSAHARDDALAEDLVDPARASVVGLGVDHRVAPADQRSSPPAGTQRLQDGGDVILCLGTDFHHKNRLFALRMLERLKPGRGWHGMLVLAGSNVPHGSSREQEAGFLRAHPELVSSVLDVGAVSEAEKAWLFARSALVLYPSVVEGFGLIPFEAAAHGTPCMWAAVSSLGELLPADAAEIVPWDAGLSAERALALMRDEGARARNLEVVRAAAEPLTWDATAARLIELYEAVADAPARTASAQAPGPLAEDAMRLVGPGGELPADVHRPLLALATHPHIAAPFFGALKLGYRASHRLRSRAHMRR